MMALLEALENSGFATWVREAETVFAYHLFLGTHAIGLAFLVGPNAAIDLRILGFARRLPLAPMESFFPLMWVGFWVNALSGLVLCTTIPVSLATDPIFYIKLGFIALAVVNLRLIRREVFRSSPASLATATTPLSTKAKILAGTSLVFWTAAILTGRMMAYAGFIRWATLWAFLILTVVALLAGFIATRRLAWSKPVRQDV